MLLPSLVKGPPKNTLKKTGISSGRKADSSKRNIVFSPKMKVHYFDRDDMIFDDMGHTTKELEHKMRIAKMVDGSRMVVAFLVSPFIFVYRLCRIYIEEDPSLGMAKASETVRENQNPNRLGRVRGRGGGFGCGFRIKRYIDTKPNHDFIHLCLKNPLYKFTWADKEVPISEGSPVIRTESYMETYMTVLQDIRDQLNAEAEVVQIILTGKDNDIYSTVDACPNACEMWKAIERLKQGESINVQDLETNLYWEFEKFTSQDGESLESYYSRSQQAATRNRGKAIVNSPQSIYDQEPSMDAEDDETSKDKEIDKLMALISLLHVARECQKPKRVKDAAYHREKMLLCKQEEAGI
nr:hypothetical protein [Tanacetum cinerariifolium]